VTAVGDMMLDVRAGTVTGLIGPNGAGKTTLINVVTRFLSIDSGSIMFEGEEIERRESHEIAKLGIARTFQNVRLFSGMTVLEQVLAGCYQRRKATLVASFLGLPGARREYAELVAEAQRILKRVGIGHTANIVAETLSYGEQRRVEIARALATSPKLLLLDEPTAGMNAQESAVIGDLLVELRDAGVTIFLVDHNVPLVLKYCEYAFVMNFGRLIAQGTPKECVDHPEVQEAYFGRKRHAQR
jgi:branched-chain amino acid transport system ATP-binding protein